MKIKVAKDILVEMIPAMSHVREPSGKTRIPGVSMAGGTMIKFGGLIANGHSGSQCVVRTDRPCC